MLAVTAGAGGSPRALVAVQRYGEGRAMVFSGEASWRWKMLLPATDRSYDTFWKQAIRWLALPATDPVSIDVAAGAMPGEPLPLRVTVRTPRSSLCAKPSSTLRVTAPDGRQTWLRAAPTPDLAERDVTSPASVPSRRGCSKCPREAAQGALGARFGRHLGARRRRRSPR